MAYIKGEDRIQITMFPECIDEYIGEDNPVRVIDAFVNKLDMKKLDFKRANEHFIGHPSYDPKDMLKLYIYGYINGIRSSRKLEKETNRNVELMWLIGKLTPDFKTIADFRKDNKKAIKSVFKNFTLLCKQWDLFGKELIAVDGSKFKANNSKRNNYSSKKINRHLEYIDNKIDEYMLMLEKQDDEEINERKLAPDEIKEKIEILKSRKLKYENFEKQLDENGENELSTTDEDARLMVTNNNSVEVSYNVQTSVDSKHKLIVDFEVTNNPADQGQLSNMAIRSKEIFGVDKLEALADKGYYNGDDLVNCEENDITTYVTKQVFSNATGERDFYSDRFRYDKENDCYICPIGHRLTRKINKDGSISKQLRYQNYLACEKCKSKDKCTNSKKGRHITRSKHQDFLDIVDARTRINKEKYTQRQMIVEHPFGTVKRSMNSGYFLTRGFDSVRAETSLSFLAYNLKRVLNILGIKEIIKKLEVV